MEADQFTLDDANALIPWLSERFRKLNTLRQKYAALQNRIADFQIPTNKFTNAGELKMAAEQIDRQIRDGLESILDQGIIVRDVSNGLVDFPSERDGREIYLCWINGEAQIDYWHETDRGFSHREPL